MFGHLFIIIFFCTIFLLFLYRFCNNNVRFSRPYILSRFEDKLCSFFNQFFYLQRNTLYIKKMLQFVVETNDLSLAVGSSRHGSMSVRSC